MDAYNAVFELATAAGADHAGQRLDHLADYHPATTHADSSGRVKLIVTLPTERTAHQAEQHALALVKVTGHRPVWLQVLLAEKYDRQLSIALRGRNN